MTSSESTLVKPEKKPSEPPAPAPHTEPEKTAKEKPATVSAPTLAGARKKRTTSQKTERAVDPEPRALARITIDIP